MKQIVEDHEEVRKFVESQTNGFVEKIEARSTSKYAPTLDSLEEVKGEKPRDVFIERMLMQHRLKESPTFLPMHYDAKYAVTVVYPPGDSWGEFEVGRVADTLHLTLRKVRSAL